MNTHGVCVRCISIEDGEHVNNEEGEPVNNEESMKSENNDVEKDMRKKRIRRIFILKQDIILLPPQ